MSRKIDDEVQHIDLHHMVADRIVTDALHSIESSSLEREEWFACLNQVIRFLTGEIEEILTRDMKDE